MAFRSSFLPWDMEAASEFRYSRAMKRLAWLVAVGGLVSMIRNTQDNIRGEVLLTLVDALEGDVAAGQGRGQRELVNSQTQLPTHIREPNGWGILEEMGVELLGQTEGDPMFSEVRLPEGWTKRAQQGTHLWTDLLDDKGRLRGQIFYQSAFWEREAFMNLLRRFWCGRDPEVSTETRLAYSVRDGGTQCVFLVSEVVPDFHTQKAQWLEVIDDVKQRLESQVEAWLTERYPNWKSLTAYWDEP